MYYLVIIIYLFTDYKDDSKFIVLDPRQQLFYVAKPREIVPVEGDNINLPLSEKSIDRYFIIPKTTLLVRDADFLNA